MSWLKKTLFTFTPLSERWVLYCIGLTQGIWTASGYDWKSAIATGITVYITLSVLKYVTGGDK